MMTCSEGCGEWAQWRVSAPEKDGHGKILRLKTIAILCANHKKAMEQAQPSDPDLRADVRFNFVGAIPDGVYRT